MRIILGSIAAAVLSAMFSIPAGAAPGAAARLAPDWAAGPSAQRAYSASRIAPAAFRARYGEAWWERRGGPTGDFRRLFGEGAALDPAVEGDDAVAIWAVERFFAENADLLPAGVSPADLSLRATVAWDGKRIVAFDQEVDGVPIEGAVAYAVIVRDRIVLCGVRLYPVRPAETRALVAPEDAERTAAAALSKLRGTPGIASAARHVLVPLVGEDALELRPAFSIALRIEGQGKWTAFVDARDGALLDLRDERVTASGTIQIEHHDRNPDGDLIAGPGAFLDLVANGADVTTDATGAFTAAGATADVTGRLSGPYVDVQNMAGDDLELAITGLADGATHLWVSDGSALEQAQLDVYVSALAVTERARSLQDDVPWLGETLDVLPNQYTDISGDGVEDVCNAWSDGDTINFLIGYDDGGGYGCNNSASVADIVYHEYGHCLHIQNAMMGVGVFDGSASEAFADTMSVSMTHSSVIGQGFYLGGGGIRDVEPDKIWPEDFIEDESAVHSNGLILGGALWDLRKALVAELGETDGHRLTEEIFVDMLRLTEDIPTSFEAALAADDDDGDLANGTPNLCPIYDAFDAHGLASGGLGRIAIAHEPIAFQPAPGIPIPVVAEIYELQAECSTLGDARLAYSLDKGGSWTEIAMASTGGDGYAAELPAMPAGTEIRYRIEADELDTAQTVTRPDNAAEPFYAIYVGPLAEILCDGFEGEDDGGWTHELLAGEDILGADDWQRDTPTGKGGDPEGAYAGESVWGNDLGLYFGPDENWNGKYQDGKINTLRSPAFDLSDYETVRLVFRRWLNVQDGNFDRARIYVNEQEVWSNFESPGSATDPHVTHHQDKEWILADIDISALAGGQAEVELRFELQSNPGSYYFSSQYGGWTIDELCLYTADEEFLPQEDAGADAGDPDGDAGPVTATAFSMGGCGCDAAGRATAGGSLLSAILGSF